LFANLRPPETLIAPDNLDFIYDVVNDHPETLDTAIKFMTEWIPSLRDLHEHLFIFLNYAPSSRASATVSYCWRRIKHSTEVVESLIRRIFEDPRYDKIPQELKQFRPSARLAELINCDVDAIPTLLACDRLLRRAGASSGILRESYEQILSLIDITAGRLAVLSVSRLYY
jgi:hypothetical protein